MKVSNPKTEKELAEMGLFPAGVYDAEIINAEDRVSKSGNDMIWVKLKVFNGSEMQFVDDYNVDGVMEYKLRHLCDACGIVDQYEAGEVSVDDINGKSVRVKLKIQKDKTGEYPDKNAVADYVVGEKDSGKTLTEELGDSIPF